MQVRQFDWNNSEAVPAIIFELTIGSLRSFDITCSKDEIVWLALRKQLLYELEPLQRRISQGLCPFHDSLYHVPVLKCSPLQQSSLL